MDIQEARDIIRAVDTEMASLFEKRMEAAREIAAYKKAHGLPVEDRAQEAKVIAAQADSMKDPELRPYYLEFLRDTIAVSRRWQQHLME